MLASSVSVQGERVLMLIKGFMEVVCFKVMCCGRQEAFMNGMFKGGYPQA